MELTIEQGLQQGVTAHKEGKLEEAERLYRAILQSQPEHPEANHNLGVIAVSVNRADVALTLFKTALEANPKIEQFWLSYIDALIKEKHFENVKLVIEQAKTQGVAKEKLNILETQLTPTAHVNEPKLAVQNKSLSLSQKRKKLAEQKKQKKAKKQNLKAISPSESEIKNLLEHYQNGRFSNAEKLATSITQKFPKHQFAWTVLGAVLKQTGRVIDALTALRKSVELAPQDAAAHSNLGVTLTELGRLDEAEASCTQAIALKPDYAEAYNNLGNSLQRLGRLDEAEASYTQAIELKPDFAEAHSNLGNTLKELGRLDEAEKSFTQAIVLKPDFAEAHSSLGNTHKELGKLDEAEASCKQAIALKPDYAEAHNNLGITLQELGRLDEAEANCKQAIALKPDFADAHNNLGAVLCMMGDIDSGLEAFRKAENIDPKSDNNKFMSVIMQARKDRGRYKAHVDNLNEAPTGQRLTANPLMLSRTVEKELISTLYEMNSSALATAPGPRYGNGRCSPDYNLFNTNCSVIKAVAHDLKNIMKLAVKSEIFVQDSFFNIYGTEAGIGPHSHVNLLDRDKNLKLEKYSLVYYVSVGDQDCSEPGILKFYDPDEEVLPLDGMIMIFPASRLHSAVYGGKTDRVMIGVNFYSL